MKSPPLLQRKCPCGKSASSGEKCPECERKLQRKPETSAQMSEVPPFVHEVLASPGQPLDAETRAFMEPRFGHDFSKVAVQRQVAPAASTNDSVIAPLSDTEWQGIYLWLAKGEVQGEHLTNDADHNADLMASAIFRQRTLPLSGLASVVDPLFCPIPDKATADPRVGIIRLHVISRGPIIHWPAVSEENRVVYVMNLLVDTYHYPVNAAAGIVGNLIEESQVLPSKIEDSKLNGPPMTAPKFGAGDVATPLTPEEVMNRNKHQKQGPLKAGVGLAQWTWPSRREGLFQQVWQGRPLGSSVLFNMDAQVGYLVAELQKKNGDFAKLNKSLSDPWVNPNDATDNFFYQNERPEGKSEGKRNKRIASALQALQWYESAHQQ